MSTEIVEAVVDQEAANLALMLDQEIDKRVAHALCRLLDPSNLTGGYAVVSAGFDSFNSHSVKTALAAVISKAVVNNGTLVNELMTDGGLMHTVRTKIAEHLNKRM